MCASGLYYNYLYARIYSFNAAAIYIWYTMVWRYRLRVYVVGLVGILRNLIFDKYINREYYSVSNYIHLHNTANPILITHDTNRRRGLPSSVEHEMFKMR